MKITSSPKIQKDANVTGLLVVGGEGGLQSVEFWAPPPLSGSDTNHRHWNQNSGSLVFNVENFQPSVSSVIYPTGISIIPLTRSMGRFERLQRLPSQMNECIKLVS